jgi:pectinesterase
MHHRLVIVFLLSTLTTAGNAASPTTRPTHFTVSPDGSGDYKSVQEAINAAPQISARPAAPFVIHVKPGTYEELVYVQREKRFICVVGEDPATTTVRHGLYAGMKGPDGKDIGTFRTPTVQVDADDFTVANLTIANSAGPKGQALALRADGDRIAFSNCHFTGWQDTIFLNRGGQYFKDCRIAGATDFIFGGATAYFDHCTIEVLGNGYVTAASTPDFQPHGFVFDHCRITSDKPNLRTYLGRPWRGCSATTFLNSEMAAIIRPEGWHNWNQPDREKTARYAEYHNTGPGADPARRVPWARQLTDDEAAQFSREKVLGDWDPARQLATTRPAQ